MISLHNNVEDAVALLNPETKDKRIRAMEEDYGRPYAELYDSSLALAIQDIKQIESVKMALTDIKKMLKETPEEVAPRYMGGMKAAVGLIEDAMRDSNKLFQRRVGR